jgi:hypothetical protein
VKAHLTLDPSLAVPLPDLNNRAPSLVDWIAREIDADVWRLLLKESASPPADQLVSDPVTLIFVGFERQRAWERAWRLNSHLGFVDRVSIAVAEHDETTVLVKVGDNIVAQAVPPWIQRRAQGTFAETGEDRRERDAFYRGLLDAMTTGLDHERSLSRDLGQNRMRPGWSES